MQLTEDQTIDKYGKKCMHCTGITLLPFEYDWTGFSCGCNVMKRKNELLKVQRKKSNFY